MPGILNYLGFSGSVTPKTAEKTPVRALPASWYTTQEMYDLEKRAIFSRRWQLITHKCRLSKPGDWLKFDSAGYEFVLCKDRKGQINGFHNVCRHRAYPIVEKESGSSRIFACKYHGWSYGLDGKLAKAPKYDELEGFIKSENSLFPIHVRVDETGFVWVNLDANEVPEVAWEEDFSGIDVQERYSVYNFDDYVLDHVWEMEGAYNWKICADNFNECYHCPTSHPDIPALLDIETLDTSVDNGWIKHHSIQDETQKADGLGVASTYFYPNVSISVLPHFIMLQRFVPTGPRSSIMQYQIFRNKNSQEEDFQRIHQLYKKVVQEDKDLCRLSQENLNRGVFVNGLMHPRLERGPLFFQQKNREVIHEFREKELAARREIWPASRTTTTNADGRVSKEDEALCSGLACHTNQEGIVW